MTGLGSDVNPAYQFVGNSSTTSDSTLTILGTNVTTYAGSIKDQAPTWDTTNFFGSQRLGLTLAAGNIGSLTLGGINAYTGPTLLNGGTLLVNGSLSNTVVTVNSGATLGGTGVIAGPVSVNNGGTLALGAAIGTLAISNNVSLAAGSTNVMKVNLNNLTSDQLVGASTLAYGGTLVVNNVGTAAFTGGTTLKLFDAAAYVGDFASIAPAVPGPGMTWDTSSLKINGTLKVVGSGVNPTPITMASAINGSQLTFSWPTDHIGWSLQTNAVDVSNPSLWFTLPGSTVTNEIIINIDQSRANVFYRMALPQ